MSLLNRGINIYFTISKRGIRLAAKRYGLPVFRSSTQKKNVMVFKSLTCNALQRSILVRSFVCHSYMLHLRTLQPTIQHRALAATRANIVKREKELS
jgi:hypothetical protein